MKIQKDIIYFQFSALVMFVAKAETLSEIVTFLGHDVSFLSEEAKEKLSKTVLKKDTFDNAWALSKQRAYAALFL